MESMRGLKLEQLLAPNATSAHGMRGRLNESEFEHLSQMCRQMAAFYPHQELCAETVQGYLHEFERLAATHGVRRLECAFVALRSRPGQKFFPHPSEVAEEIDSQIETEQQARLNQSRDERAKRTRQTDILAFWNEFLPDRMQRFGWTEEDALRRFPSFRGTKPNDGQATKPNVVSMPSRDEFRNHSTRTKEESGAFKRSDFGG